MKNEEKVKNADMPASPVAIQFGKAYHENFDGNGLTKREHFAESILNGLLASGINIQLGPNSKDNNDKMAACAVTLADALLAALNQGE